MTRRRKKRAARLELRLVCPFDRGHDRFATERRVSAREDVVDGRGRCVETIAVFDVVTAVDALAATATCDECGAACVLIAKKTAR